MSTIQPKKIKKFSSGDRKFKMFEYSKHSKQDPIIVEWKTDRWQIPEELQGKNWVNTMEFIDSVKPRAKKRNLENTVKGE